MTAKNKLLISRSLLQETIDYIPDENAEFSIPFKEIIDSIDEYVRSGAIDRKDSGEADRISFRILIDVINSCLPHILTQYEMTPGKKEKRRRKPKREIEDDLSSCLGDSKNEAREMNINEWMEENGYVLCDELMEKGKDE